MPKFTPDNLLDEWFDHHPPSSYEIVQAHETIRTKYKALAKEMNALLPEGPDKTIALRAIRDAAMYANGCVAVAQAVYVPDSRPWVEND